MWFLIEIQFYFHLDAIPSCEPLFMTLTHYTFEMAMFELLSIELQFFFFFSCLLIVVIIQYNADSFQRKLLAQQFTQFSLSV